MAARTHVHQRIIDGNFKHRILYFCPVHFSIFLSPAFHISSLAQESDIEFVGRSSPIDLFLTRDIAFLTLFCHHGMLHQTRAFILHISSYIIPLKICISDLVHLNENVLNVVGCISWKGLVPFTQLVKVRRESLFWHFRASDFHETFTRSSLALNMSRKLLSDP